MKFSEIPVGAIIYYGCNRLARAYRYPDGMALPSFDESEVLVWKKIDDDLCCTQRSYALGYYDCPRPVTGTNATQKKYGHFLFSRSNLCYFLNSDRTNQTDIDNNECNRYYGDHGFMKNFTDEERENMNVITMSVPVPNGYKRELKQDTVTFSYKVVIPNKDMIQKMINISVNMAYSRLWLCDGDTSSQTYQYCCDEIKNHNPFVDASIFPVISINKDAEFIYVNGGYILVTKDDIFENDVHAFLFQ